MCCNYTVQPYKYFRIFLFVYAQMNSYVSNIKVTWTSPRWWLSINMVFNYNGIKCHIDQILQSICFKREILYTITVNTLNIIIKTHFCSKEGKVLQMNKRVTVV